MIADAVDVLPSLQEADDLSDVSFPQGRHHLSRRGRKGGWEDGGGGGSRGWSRGWRGDDERVVGVEVPLLLLEKLRLMLNGECVLLSLLLELRDLSLELCVGW